MIPEFDNQPQKEPYALKFAILMERNLYFLSHPERKDDNAKIVFGQASQFLEEALRGQKAVESLRLSRTSHREIKMYCWWLKAFVRFEESRGAREEKDLKVALTNQSAALRRFQENGIQEQDKEMVDELTGVFKEIKTRADHALAQPTDIVRIWG